jgi:hypothetical protein
MLAHVPQPPQRPFGSAHVVEAGAARAVQVGTAAAASAPVAFLDGIQRYRVVGRIGLAPVVRGYVAAAVLGRVEGRLVAQHHLVEEFLVAPLERMPRGAVSQLQATGLAIHACETEDRPHPLLDVHLAAQVVERRREAVEARAARTQIGAAPDTWLVVDGSLAGLDLPAAPNLVLGVVKSHETQFLVGDELLAALTLAVGHRSSVFARSTGDRKTLHTWYLRLWPWDEHDLLHGLIRLERTASPNVVGEADAVSRWIMAERSPLSAPDTRWDRLVYPVHQVEEYLRARAGAAL